MKTIGRILIILAVFSLTTGLMVMTVNAVGNAVGETAPDFNGAPQFHPNGSGDGEVRPQRAENRPEHEERGGSGSRLLFGAIKNVAVIGFVVTVIVWPKSVVKKKKKTAAMISANGKS